MTVYATGKEASLALFLRSGETIELTGNEAENVHLRLKNKDVGTYNENFTFTSGCYEVTINLRMVEGYSRTLETPF